MKSPSKGRRLRDIFESYVNKITEIEESVSSWQKDDRIKANISATEPDASEEPCITIIDITHGVSDLAQALDAEASDDERRFKAVQKGMNPSDWLPVLKNCHRADSPVECQLRVLLTAIGAARKNIHEVVTKNTVVKTGYMAGRPVLELHNIDMDVDLDRIWEAFLTLKALLDRSDPYREAVESFDSSK